MLAAVSSSSLFFEIRHRWNADPGLALGRGLS